MKQLVTICLIICQLGSVSAAISQEDPKALINKIKKSKNYIYAEATLPDEAEAVELAYELLINNIDEWVAGEKKLRDAENLVLTDVSRQYETVNMNRGNMPRVFY